MKRCKSTLSLPRQKLLQVMQRNPWANIELDVSGGEPSFSPPPKITREIKLGVDATARSTPEEGDFALKRAVTDLFEHLDRLRDSVVIIEVRHGLPARLILAGEV
jgi:aspartate/methionine/tyrosine aminotransferase